MKIVTAAEMRAIDRITSERFGVPSLTLMENAGAAVAEFAMKNYPQADRIVAFCGKGNNGGDGLVTARLLHKRGKKVTVVLLADPGDLRGDAAAMFTKLPFTPFQAHTSSELQNLQERAPLNADLYLDAILGTGFKPPVSELYAAAIAVMKKSKVPVIAADIPSGADADAIAAQAGTIARADAVVTFTAPRAAHVFGSMTSGPTVVASIGSPEEAIVSSLQLNVITAHDIATFVSQRPAESNKGNLRPRADCRRRHSARPEPQPWRGSRFCARVPDFLRWRRQSPHWQLWLDFIPK